MRILHKTLWWWIRPLLRFGKVKTEPFKVFWHLTQNVKCKENLGYSINGVRGVAMCGLADDDGLIRDTWESTKGGRQQGILPSSVPAGQFSASPIGSYIFSCKEQLKKWYCQSVHISIHPFLFRVFGVCITFEVISRKINLSWIATICP